MQPWVDANLMEVRVPGQTDDQAIEKVVKDFRSFASLHNGSGNLKTAAFLGRHSATPFFSETSTSRIVSDLKKGGSTDSTETGFGSVVLRAEFFSILPSNSTGRVMN